MTLSDLHVTDKRVLHEAMLVLARYKRSSVADGTSAVKLIDAIKLTLNIFGAAYLRVRESTFNYRVNMAMLYSRNNESSV